MIGNIAKSIFNFIFPHFCIGCGERIETKGGGICTTCFSRMPRALHTADFYEISERLNGIVPFTEIHSDLLYLDDSLEKEIVLRTKYGHQPELGYNITKELAKEHLELGHFSDVAGVVPVPLNKEKMKQRGYNQSEYIAKAFSEVYNIPLVTDILKRKSGHGTQTKRSKQGRWDAMKGQFFCHDPEKRLQRRRLLLVDDVLTTGATLSHAAMVLYDEGGIESVSFYTLAVDL